jgi:hypothetical protein
LQVDNHVEPAYLLHLISAQQAQYQPSLQLINGESGTLIPGPVQGQRVKFSYLFQDSERFLNPLGISSGNTGNIASLSFVSEGSDIPLRVSSTKQPPLKRRVPGQELVAQVLQPLAEFEVVQEKASYVLKNS